MLLSLKQVGVELGVTRRTIYRWIHGGILPATMYVGMFKVEEEDLAKFKKEREGKCRQKQT